MISSSVQFSRSVVSDSLPPHELQHARPPCPSPIPRVHPNPCPSSQWFLLSIWWVCGYFPLESLFLWCLYVHSLFFFLIRFSNILTLSLPFFFFQMISILSENLSEGKWKLLRLADKLKKYFFFNVCLFGCSRSQLWHMGPSSSTRDWSWAPCIGSVTLSHWITREVQKQKF